MLHSQFPEKSKTRKKEMKGEPDPSNNNYEVIINNLKKIMKPELVSVCRILIGRSLLSIGRIKEGRIYLTKEISNYSHGHIAFRFIFEK